MFLGLLAALALGILTGMASRQAHGHDSTGQYTKWMMQQHNTRNGQCCDGHDGYLLDDNEWRIVGNHYEVFYNSTWHEVPDWAMLRTPDNNPTGRAVLWIWRGEPNCFAPATLY